MISLTKTSCRSTCSTTTNGSASNTPGMPSKAPRLSCAIKATVGRRLTVRDSNRGVSKNASPF